MFKHALELGIFFRTARPQILQLNGMSLSDFPTHTAALKAADRLVELNKEQCGHGGEVQEVPDMPLLNKFFYVHMSGKKRSWEQTESKRLEGEADVKSRKQLQDTNTFTEALGEQSPRKLCNVKEEVPGMQAMMKTSESLKSPTLSYILD